MRRAAREFEDVEIARALSGPRLQDEIVDRDGTKYAVRPNSYVELLANDQSFDFFVEVDRRTKDLDRVEQQLHAYSFSFLRGGFRRKYGDEGQAIQEWPFRVLITTTSQQRRNNMLAATIASIRPRPSKSRRNWSSLPQSEAA